MSEINVVEIYGVKIDFACAALLDIALKATYSDERKRAIDKLGELGCDLALGVVGRKATYSDERKRAIDRIGSKRD